MGELISKFHNRDKDHPNQEEDYRDPPKHGYRDEEAIPPISSA
tara:strand:+ start:422 stop:550 length:129 start_codon:yes stop_codon:yes gene_type:complete